MAQTEQNHQVAEKEPVSRSLNQLVQRNAGGAQRTWEKATVVVDSRAAENVMPRSMFSEISTEETERSKNGKQRGPRMKEGSKDRALENFGQQGHVRQNSWVVCTQRHVAGCRCGKTPRVSIPHHPIREKPVHRKKETSVLRKDGNVFVLDSICESASRRHCTSQARTRRS